jgi:hypothetical protein
MLASAAAEIMPPATVIALGGGLGAITACYLALRWRHIPPAVGRHTARHLRGPAVGRGRGRAPRTIREPCQVTSLNTAASEKAA